MAVSLIALFVRFIGFTWRFKEFTENGAEPKKGKTGQYIYGFMHSHIIPTIYYYRGGKIVSLASSHKDGEIAAKAAGLFGIKTARGSTTRGGAKGIMEIVKFIDAGYDAAITVDGPRGPRGDVKPGVLAVAKLTGKPVVMVGFACAKKIKLRSWDRMEIPLPFSSGGFFFGKPFYVKSDISDEEMERLRMEKINELKDLNDEAEKIVNG